MPRTSGLPRRLEIGWNLCNGKGVSSSRLRWSQGGGSMRTPWICCPKPVGLPAALPAGGERQALLTYWRQRISMANARGAATVIKDRTPLCIGVHHPVQPHHFSHLPAIPAPLRPQQVPHQSALPAPAVRPLLRPPAGSGLCLPCAPPLRAAGSAATSPRLLALYWLVRVARVLWLVTRVTSAYL